jgi:hypothetical protein
VKGVILALEEDFQGAMHALTKSLRHLLAGSALPRACTLRAPSFERKPYRPVGRTESVIRQFDKSEHLTP